MDKQKYEIIEIMRFIAASAVVCVHIPTIEIGHWGVDVFFIISGFVMMASTKNSGENFFIKRIIRVAPIYWLFTLGVFMIALIAPKLLNNTTPDFINLFKSILFIPFDKNGIGHFPILFVGWTLNYEMFFYFLFFIFYFL
ncbi:acyltransferase [Xenorhabdus beddingii]|uniref:Acyltransferase n=1 Tax=Xenorhabdus beddingii TaxID=40578 RepID=A0A1Y2SPG1_9GAMM|nr:acyltransferase family protein [Xenorhabdus beddingii]OTA19619.1 acyltransferase [Xenorhabdus beddingii]